MRRRGCLLAATAVAATACASGAGGLGGAPRYTLTIAQLENAVAGRFPRRYPVAGLIDLDLQAPRLRLLPAQNRLGATMAVRASGPALRHGYTGEFDVDFGLRYEPADRTVRATGLRVNALRLDGLQPRAAGLLQAYGAQLAGQSLSDVVLHQLREKDLALADGLGLQPGSITVTGQGLVVGFVPKAP